MTAEPVRFLKPTEQIQHAYAEAWYRTIGLDEEDVDQATVAEVGDPMPWRLAGLDAALAIAEDELRAHIAYRIRAELVCCDIYEQADGLRRAHAAGELADEGQLDEAIAGHQLCYWGEASARIAEDADGYHARLAAEGVGR